MKPEPFTSRRPVLCKVARDLAGVARAFSNLARVATELPLALPEALACLTGFSQNRFMLLASRFEEEEVNRNPEQFKQRMDLKTIRVSEHRELTFWHEDGDLFWGHYNNILSVALTHADIPG